MNTNKTQLNIRHLILTPMSNGMPMPLARIVLSTMALLLAAATPALAQPALRAALKDIDIAPHWIDGDLPKALEQAKESGKPLLVVLRCVPCPPGRTLDKQVMQPDADLESLEKQFVCVRLIQTNGLDLSLFQYDFDMSWSAVILNADRTIYGRYGTRNATGEKSDTILTKAAFQKSLERALALHKAYPDNKAQLQAKSPQAPDYARPEETPGLETRPHTAATRQECIHCHQVKEFALRAKWEAGKLSAADLWVYPMPQRVGMSLDIDDGLKVDEVTEGTAAAKAGMQKGDDLLAMNGQSLISTADVQWVLHNSPSDARITVTLKRDGKTVDKTLAVSGDWKQSDIAWRASSWYGLRQGVKLEALSAADKQTRGIEPDHLALTVAGLFGKGGPKLQQAGIKKGDVIVAVDGKTAAMTESEFLAWFRLNHGPKDSITFTVLRDNKRQEITLPVW